MDRRKTPRFSWEYDGRKKDFTPVRAEVRIGTTGSGKPLHKAKGVKFAGVEGESPVLEVSSGTCHFTVGAKRL